MHFLESQKVTFNGLSLNRYPLFVILASVDFKVVNQGLDLCIFGACLCCQLCHISFQYTPGFKTLIDELYDAGELVPRMLAVF